MPKADSEHTPTRRKFLGHLAGGVAIVAVATGTTTIAQAARADSNNPDAELIALCAEFDALERRCRVIIDEYGVSDEDAPDEITDPIRTRQRDLVELITAKRATTGAGFVALASTIVLWAPDLVERWSGDTVENRYEGYCEGRLVAMLLGDMAANSANGGAA